MLHSNQSGEYHPKKPFGFKLFYILVTLIIIGLVAGLIFALLARSAFSKPSAVNSSESITISSGETVSELSNNLAAQSQVPSAFWFRVYIYLHPTYGYLHAGTFVLPANSNIRQIALQLHATNPQNSLRIPEGATINDIAQIISSNSILNITKSEVFIAAEQLASTYNFLGDTTTTRPNTLEGYLFPDTYFVSANATAADLLQRMLGTENQKITPAMRDAIHSKNISINQAITIASLLEKEIGTTGTARDPQVLQQEREIVAGIINNRLRLGMPLQFDSTQNYIQPGKINPDPSYNTYKNNGLPPGPIGNPSLNSVEAVINPIQSDYLYFLTDKQGTAHFAKTIQEQDANIKTYLRGN